MNTNKIPRPEMTEREKRRDRINRLCGVGKKKRDPKIKKKSGFGRILWARYDEDADQIVYRHATKGVKRRAATPEVFRAMMA